MLRAVIVDATTGQSIKTAMLASVAPNSALVGIEDNGAPLADFGKLYWTRLSVNKTPLSALDPTGYNLVIHPNHPKTLVATSAFTPSGGSFMSRWVSS